MSENGLVHSVQSHRTKKLLYAGLALLVLIAVSQWPLPESVAQGSAPLTAAGQSALAVMLFCLVMWIAQVLPFHITGLLALVILALLRVDTFTSVVREGFGSNTAVFFLSILIISAFISESGLGRRALALTLSLTGNKTMRIIFAFLFVAVLTTMWVTAVAVTAMMVSMAQEVLKREKLEPLKSNFGRVLMMSCAYGPVIGGMATPAGAGCNPLSIDFFRDMAGIKITFIHWMSYGVPASLLMLIPTWFVLTRLFPPEMDELTVTADELRQEYRDMPAATRDEKISLGILLLTIVLWLASPWLESLLGIDLPAAMPVTLTACLLFFPGMCSIPWRRIEPHISWSGILLILTGISLGSMLYQTGAARWMASSMLGGISAVPLWAKIFLVVIVTILMKIAFSSNTVTATIIIPILIELAGQLQLDPMYIAFPAALAASQSLILVTSSPNNVIPYNTGWFTAGNMMKAGFILTPLSAAVITAVVLIRT